MKLATAVVRLAEVPAKANSRYGQRRNTKYGAIYDAVEDLRLGQALEVAARNAKEARILRARLRETAMARGFTCMLRGNAVYLTRGAKAAPASNWRG